MTAPLGLWFAGPRATVRHAADFPDWIDHRSDGTIRYRSACDRGHYTRHPGEPHPVDRIHAEDLRPCAKCLDRIEQRVRYLTEILTTNGRTA